VPNGEKLPNLVTLLPVKLRLRHFVVAQKSKQNNKALTYSSLAAQKQG